MRSLSDMEPPLGKSVLDGSLTLVPHESSRFGQLGGRRPIFSRSTGAKRMFVGNDSNTQAFTCLLGGGAVSLAVGGATAQNVASTNGRIFVESPSLIAGAVLGWKPFI